jgi:hypothetical protein
MSNVYNLCRVKNCYNSRAHCHERHGPSHDWMEPEMGLVWFGWLVEVDFIRMWVDHGVTP